MTGRAATVADLAAAAGGEVIGDGATLITGISYDSRAIVPGDLFVCLPGGYADGHDYAAGAVSAGAAALLVEHRLPLDSTQILVGATRRELAAVAAAFYGNPGTALTVVGVTGTDGKTTTSAIVDHLLRSAGRRTGVVGTVSVRIADEVVDHETRQTTPESADVQRLLRKMVDAGVSHATLEATSHGLDLHRLDHVPFDVAAVTNITSEHLEHHGTVEAYRAAKAILFRRVAAAGGVAVVNLDDEGARSMLGVCASADIVTYSMTDPSATVYASDVIVTPTGSTFVLTVGGVRHRAMVPLTGGFNVANALCALGVATACDVDLGLALSALASTPQVPGRLHVVDPTRPVTTIVDYAHTPASLEVMMRTIRSSSPNGRLIAVFGSGGERDVAKRPLQGQVAARLADLAVFTNEDPREEDELAILADIAAGARAEGWVEGREFWTIPDRREAIRHAVGMAEPGDVLLLAGKGHERSIIVGQRKTPWDEAVVAREELARRFGEAP